LRERIRFLGRTSLLIVDEMGYLPVIPGGGNLFFQLVNARYEKGAMILTSTRGFAEWGQVFGCAPRSPSSPRRRQRVELSAPPACRPHARAPPLRGPHQLANPGTAAAPPRSPTQKWSSWSHGRLTTVNPPPGEFYLGTSGEN